MKFRYEDLDVTVRIQVFIDKIYTITTLFPGSERFGLISQARRAATSVLLNLAEGSARNSKPDFARFLTISLGSLVETHAILKISLARKYLKQEQFDEIQPIIEEVWAKLCALRSSQK